MTDQHPKDELAALKSLCAALRTGDMKLKVRGQDRSQAELQILEREIKHLEEILADLRRKGSNYA